MQHREVTEPTVAGEVTTPTSAATVNPTAMDDLGCLVWQVDPDCCDWPGDTAPEIERQRAERAQRIASDRLRRLTGGQYGLCETWVRPCLDRCRHVPWDDRWGRWLNPPDLDASVLRPYLERGVMYNLCMGGCVDDCSCAVLCRTTLPGPVHEVIEVRLDGQVLDAASYVLTPPPDNWLVRVDGGCWPYCQDMTASVDQAGSFVVRYFKGRDPSTDPDAIRAYGTLACELYKQFCGSRCRLPGRIRTVNREGISYEVMEDWPRLGTGLPEVDDWLALVNPNSLRAPAAVYTPDAPQTRFYSRGS